MAATVRMASTAHCDLEAIPPRYAAAILEFIYGVLPRNPRRLDKPLDRDLAGLHSARRGDYRVIYEIVDDDREILIVRVDHRPRVHRPR